MSELRWHPIRREWVIVATHRQARTFLPPKDFCPLCPTKDPEFPTEIPRSDFEFAVFENKFPAMKTPPPEMSMESDGLFLTAPSEGICEVVLYTPRHEGTLTDASTDEIEKLIYVWTDRFTELGSSNGVKYVFIFENKGEVIGVTIHHPHGQIYAFGFVPPFAQIQLDSAREHHEAKDSCLFCDLLAQELEDGRRIVARNDDFAAVVPFYARWAYEVHITPTRHHPTMLTFSDSERRSLAEILKVVMRKYDSLWGISMPYMMCMYQAPTDGAEHDYFHYHIEFYPPHRTKEKLKYLAGCESAMGTFVSDTYPEEKAAELRAAEPKT